MREVQWWGLLSSGTAPVLLIGGWTVAAALQPTGFDPLVESISALAGGDATDRWVMSLALFGVGVCHLATAMALRPVALAARLCLAAGGVATMAVAGLPLPGGEANSLPHVVAAVSAFLALAVWPALAGRRSVVPVLRPPFCLIAAGVLVLLVSWFFIAVLTQAPLLGLSERLAAGAQSLYPLVVVGVLRRTALISRPAAQRS